MVGQPLPISPYGDEQHFVVSLGEQRADGAAIVFGKLDESATIELQR